MICCILGCVTLCATDNMCFSVLQFTSKIYTFWVTEQQDFSHEMIQSRLLNKYEIPRFKMVVLANGGFLCILCDSKVIIQGTSVVLTAAMQVDGIMEVIFITMFKCKNNSWLNHQIIMFCFTWHLLCASFLSRKENCSITVIKSIRCSHQLKSKSYKSVAKMFAFNILFLISGI